MQPRPSHINYASSIRKYEGIAAGIMIRSHLRRFVVLTCREKAGLVMAPLSKMRWPCCHFEGAFLIIAELPVIHA
jgi:hypothetical protein